ncbi:MAG: ABC transporter ATP-binding protein/permease [Acetatifactor sp.]|nr:ABC transporter ATP-binding protein/permease [Acetatifactor sp.]
MKHEKQSKRATIRKVFRLIMSLEPGFFPLLLFVKMIAAIHPFINVVFGSRIIDMVIQKQTVNVIMQTVLVMAACHLILGVVHWRLESVLGVKRCSIDERITQIISEKSLQLDYELLERKETLELVFKAQEGMTSNGGIGFFCTQLGNLVELAAGLVYSLVLFLGVCIPVKTAGTDTLTKVLNAWWSPVFLAAAAVFVLAAKNVLQRQNGRQSQMNFERNVEYNRRFGYFFHFLTSYKEGKDIRVYHMQNMIMDGLRESNENYERSMGILRRWTNRYMTLNQSLLFFLQMGSYLYVGLKAIAGLISVGSVLQYIAAFWQLCRNISDMMGVYVNVEIQSRYLSLFEDFMELENKKYEGTLPVEKREDNRYEIEFKDVSFRYPNSTEDVLSHVNAKFRIGEKTAIVGQNGAGKTTFIKLLCRLYDPTKGEILLNGINIRYYDYREYMSLFSVVFQDFWLFSLSIAENVAVSTEYDEERVIDCIRQAGLGERLGELPEGIRTNLYQLQENGIEISGGEAQKLAIARALYKDAAFVVLDEPTSALDPVSEYDIYRRFNELVEEKTAVYISHRMSSCRFCDNIFVFDKGRIIQKGSHETLMREDGRYRELWNAQAQYYQ